VRASAIWGGVLNDEKRPHRSAFLIILAIFAMAFSPLALFDPRCDAWPDLSDKIPGQTDDFGHGPIVAPVGEISRASSVTS
jgi:hypothetical protein